MNGLVRGCALALALAAALVAPARADSSGDLGLTLNPILGGIHDSYDDMIHLPAIPVPLLEGDYRIDNVELTGYGLPPTIPIPYTDAIQGSVALRLSILDATLRLWGPGRFFGVGVGETVYNQTTHYATADGYAPGGDERQYSRIAGAHYEVVARLPFRAGSIETSLRYAPVLLGTQVSTYSEAPSRFDPERGEQIDGSVRYVHHVGPHMDAVLGVRYVNFTAAYDIPSRPLSDRNAAVLPSFGYLWRL
ncbi:MAG: hypothetical protein ABSH03_03870 [Candidatus Lustribacter sp.]|jgi:hypothetical protein